MPRRIALIQRHRGRTLAAQQAVEHRVKAEPGHGSRQKTAASLGAQFQQQPHQRLVDQGHALPAGRGQGCESQRPRRPAGPGPPGRQGAVQRTPQQGLHPQSGAQIHGQGDQYLPAQQGPGQGPAHAQAVGQQQKGRQRQGKSGPQDKALATASAPGQPLFPVPPAQHPGQGQQQQVLGNGHPFSPVARNQLNPDRGPQDVVLVYPPYLVQAVHGRRQAQAHPQADQPAPGQHRQPLPQGPQARLPDEPALRRLPQGLPAPLRDRAAFIPGMEGGRPFAPPLSPRLRRGGGPSGLGAALSATIRELRAALALGTPLSCPIRRRGAPFLFGPASCRPAHRL